MIEKYFVPQIGRWYWDANCPATRCTRTIAHWRPGHRAWTHFYFADGTRNPNPHNLPPPPDPPEPESGMVLVEVGGDCELYDLAELGLLELESLEEIALEDAEDGDDPEDGTVEMLHRRWLVELGLDAE